MRRFLAGLLGWRGSPRLPSMRLSEGEAVAIAAAVIERPGFGVQRVAQAGDRVVWTVATRNRGVNEWVRIADDTGEMHEHRRAGLR